MPILHWLDRDKTIKQTSKVPYRLLEADQNLSYGSQDSQNLLIQGDNLEALKALLPYYAGKVKCIFIDPPYNTKSAFEHYDDSLEHTKWLETIYPRIELLRELLSEDGSIWVTIDDNEAHYLKVIMDEIFGRNNFVANIVWQKRTSPDVRAVMSSGHDHIITFAKKYESFRESRNTVSLSEESKSRYKNPDNDPNGPWASSDYTAQGFRPNQMYSITTPSGKVYAPPAGRCWKNIESVFLRLVDEGKIWFGKDGAGIPRRKNYLKDADGHTPWTWWSNKDVGHNQEAKKEINVLFGAENAFDTPKPERLIQRIIQIATNENDLVLDSFLGSGTTSAVAHKMNRRWIGIEMGEHAKTHCALRLQKVIDGEQGGISKDASWQGGGGFHFYNLGEAIFDEDGQVNKNIRFEHLAAHIWFSETKTPFSQKEKSPLLGICNGTAYYLLFNGILGDKSISGGNVLTSKTLAKIFAALPNFNGPKIIYGETSRLGQSRLEENQITFKQTPYDIKAR